MTRFGAVLDACVLVPMPLADTLLRFAERGTYQPIWSDVILSEVERAIVGLGYEPAIARRRTQVMRDYFPEAMASCVEEATTVAGLPDPDDEHVLAAARISNAEAIVTSNLAHFPVSVCSSFDVDVLSPDDFLAMQFDTDPEIACRIITEQAHDLRDPPVPVSALLGGLRREAPTFADLVEMKLRRRRKS